MLRGFTAQAPDGSVDPPAPPEGRSPWRASPCPRDRLEGASRRALDDLEATAPCLPVVVQATEADDPALVPVPPPDLGEGPTSRTVQWFLFSAVAVVGYPLLLRTRATA